MPDQNPLFDINPRLNTKKLAKKFAETGRVQAREFLTDASANAIHRILKEQTPWGLSWRGASRNPQTLIHEQLSRLTQEDLRQMSALIEQAMRSHDYAFSYRSFSLAPNHAEGWVPGPPHSTLFESLSGSPFIEFMREVSGISELVKVDGLASFFGPGQFLSLHTDGAKPQARRVAYVLNLCKCDWRPDWGGYLNFYDDDGNVVDGFMPTFNTLNFFRVPHTHNVTMVAPYAPQERFAITGWFYDS